MLVGHKHVTVNGKRVDRVSYLLSAGDEVAVVGEKVLAIVRGNAGEVGKARSAPGWLEASPESGTVRVREMPKREDIPEEIQEQLVVELYGR